MSAGETKKKMHGGPNMTPMVDVVMCILIFFMLGSSFFMAEPLLASQTPVDIGSHCDANAPLPAVRFTLSLERRGDETWFCASDGTAMKGVDKAAISKYLAEKRRVFDESVQVLIAPASQVSYQDTITVYDACVGAKFRQTGFAPAH